jgi:hypothetical protein
MSGEITEARSSSWTLPALMLFLRGAVRGVGSARNEEGQRTNGRA